MKQGSETHGDPLPCLLPLRNVYLPWLLGPTGASIRP